MTNILTPLTVFTTPNGIGLIALGTLIGAVFATIIFSFTVLGMPMLLDRDIDFVTPMIASMGAVRQNPMIYLLWGAMVGALTLIVMPLFGHATYHLYARVTGTIK